MRVLTFSSVSSVFLFVLISSPRAQADVYRCVSGGGHISYQQIPCSSESKPMQLKDRRSGWSSLRPGERALLNSYRKSNCQSFSNVTITYPFSSSRINK